nr:threonine/serine exporter family protein [Helicobacter sp. MIT 99-5507]
MLISVLIDGGFAAIAGLGFAFGCNPPIKTLFLSALLASIAHASRFYLLHHIGIASATFIAAFFIGLLGLIFAKKTKCPMEIITFPALLPMIPGMYAYRTILSIASFGNEDNLEIQYKLLIEITNNLMTTISVAFALAVGISITLIIFHEQSLMMTRKSFRKESLEK